MTWEQDLFVERTETLEILPPKAGLPPGLDKYLTDGVLHQPLVRRKCPITGDWAHMNMARAERPMARMNLKMEQGDCLFCRGKEDKTPGWVSTGGDYLREGGDEWTLRAFPNLYPWLIQHLNIVETATHKTSLAELDDAEELHAWKAAARITADLEKQRVYPMVFRNHGFGSSIAHYHWQAGALPYMPNRILEETTRTQQFAKQWDTSIFDALITAERRNGKRWIAEDEHTAVVAAYAPRTAFETWLIVKDRVTSLAQCSDAQLSSLCTQLDNVLRKLNADAGVDTMNIIFHQLPAWEQADGFRLHLEIMPFKHLGGAERGFGEYAIEVLPERAADILRG
jgi:UDPglucose--hexose-1-phosphate uridylyltransferase